MLSSVVRQTLRGRSRTLSSLVSFDEDYPETLSPLSQLLKVETSVLPNGVKVVTTPKAAASCQVIKLEGLGSAVGAAGCGFAVKMMALKSANGRTDLRIQRDLELTSATPFGKVQKTSVVLGVEGLPEFAKENFEILAVNRSEYVPWEFHETLDVTITEDPLKTAIETAAWGEGSFFARPPAKHLTKLDPTQVYESLTAAMASAPITVVASAFFFSDHSLGRCSVTMLL